jgi:hypothetical protein
MAWYLGLTVREYREVEAGELLPSWEVVDRIDRLFGWPRTFAEGGSGGRKRAVPRKAARHPRTR